MSTPTLPGPLVSVAWLQAHLADVVLLDASLVAPVSGGAGVAPTLAIPGAQVFDHDKTICDRSSPLPHMMPTAAVFEAAARALGIGVESRVIVYDRVGTYASPRAWWMFKAMGHEAVAVLDGGLPAWLAAGLEVGFFGGPRAPGDFVARPGAHLFCDADAVAVALQSPAVAVVDARSAGRFFGREPEPRAGLRLGHMPGAVNLFFGDMQQGGAMRPVEALKARIAATVGGRERLVLSCGSGVTACIVALAAELAGYRDLVVYDGSWSEWGLPSDRPVVTDGP
jgi:thiosulfate/3-mercaptopyruvate sulfurtransferase